MLLGNGAISVCVINYNGAGYLPRTLEAVAQLGDLVVELFVADDGSTDGSVALVRRDYPHVRVVEHQHNRGVSACRNSALGAATQDRVLLIDNDVRPLPGCVELLHAALDAHPAALCAMPAIIYEDEPDMVQYVGAESHFLGVPALGSPDSAAAQLDTQVQTCSSLITCAVLVDKARWADRPWFDEDFFLYLEDHELGLRVALSGFELLTVPEARCLHGAGTVDISIRQTGRFTPRRVRQTMLNRWQVIIKLYQIRTMLRFAPALLAFEIFQFLGAIYKGWLGHWLWAVAALLGRLPRLMRKRRAFGKQRQRPDLDVLTGGPFPYNKAMHSGRLERAAQRLLDAIVRCNWHLTGGRR
ncbi:MAG: glycosyltransferase family 2 protein [Phycisphaeraceae bacterium]|nr:glycosyltransferase family 2 protein [Phycisphaeraceae bacterium]